MSDIRTIGFIVHKLNNEYTSSLLHGIIPAAEKAGMNLVILPGGALDRVLFNQPYSEYEYQNNILYDFCTENSLDGLIISAGTVGVFCEPEKFRRFVDGFGNLPVVTLETKIGDHPCVRFDGSGMYSMVEHLIKKHGVRRIAFVGGPAGNSDADLRFEAYRKALEDNDIPIDSRLIAFGNFSEYSSDAVISVLDSGGEPQAICFANDSMCIGGYQVLKERGLVPGKDILVTGFDDSEITVRLEPNLSSVCSNASIMGFEAVSLLERMMNGEKNIGDICPESRLIIRESCGCSGPGIGISDNADFRSAAEALIRSYIDIPPVSSDMSIVEDMISAQQALMTAVSFKTLTAEDISGVEIRADKLLEMGLFHCITPKNVTGLIDSTRKYLLNIDSGGNSMIINDLFRILERKAISFYIAEQQRLTADYSNAVFYISNITKDMTLLASDGRECIYSVLHKLSMIGLAGSSIFSYSSPVRNSKDDKWMMPSSMILTGCQDGTRIEIPKRSKARISSDSVFADHSGSGRQRVMVASVIFSGELQYGLLICEATFPQMKYIRSIVPQICTAMRMNMLVSGLENSLSAEKLDNAFLREVSMTDELTHVYNRRGFFIHADKEISDSRNEGSTAYLIYADLNSLKKINDTFGHDEGDYAISLSADILNVCLNSGSVVGRLGGDEFAALTILPEKGMENELYKAIKRTAHLHSSVSDKPFNVCLSVGIHAFPCSEGVSVQEQLEFADAALYSDKLTKDPDILKKA